MKTALVEAAKAAGRTQTYLGAQYRRLARRIGANRAALAVAHSIAVISHRIIDRGEDYVDLGYHYFEQRGSRRHYPPRGAPTGTPGAQRNPPSGLTHFHGNDFHLDLARAVAPVRRTGYPHHRAGRKAD